MLSSDMSLNMALPCRISVYEDSGATKIGMIRPTAMLSQLSEDAKLSKIAEDLESKTISMIDEAR